MPLIILREYSLKRKMKNSYWLASMMSISLSRSLRLSYPGKMTWVMALIICFLLDCRVKEFLRSLGSILGSEYLLLLFSRCSFYMAKMLVFLPLLFPRLF
jgi:hypothetical protein